MNDSIAWVVISAVAVVVAAFSHDRHRLAMMSVLFGFNLLYNATWIYPDQLNPTWWPLTDTLSGVVAGNLWVWRHDRWKLAVLGISTAQLIAHMAFYATRISGLGEYWTGYLDTLNLLYVAQVGATAWGGWHHVGRRLRSFLSHIRAGAYPGRGAVACAERGSDERP